MTVPILRIKVLPKPLIKGRMDVRFPANIHVEKFLKVDRANGTYTFDIDYTLLSGGPVSDPANAFIAVLDIATGLYRSVSLNSLLTSGLDADLQAIAALTGTGILVRTADDTWAQRSITAGSYIGVTDGDGVSGNPTITITDPELVALADLVSAADKLPYFDGAGSAALADFTAFARSLIDDADAGTARGTLGLGAMAVLNDVSISDIDATGTPSSSTYLRGDGSWQTPAGGGGGSPTISPGDEKKVIQVNADSDAYELVPAQNVSANSVSLLSLLTDAEAADVLAGTNSIDISAKIAAAITDLATNSPGFTLDMSMLHGEVTVTQDWFGGLATAKGRIVTGAVKLLVNFNNMNFQIPSYMTWESRGTKIESSTTITGVANREGGIGYLVNTFVGGQGRTCSSTTINTITVSDADGIEVGATIAVYGTQRDFNFQFTLGAAINSTATSIAITGASVIDPGVVMLRLSGTEYVFGLFSGGTLDTTYTGGGRGKLGTSATSHSNGAGVLLMQSMVRTVTEINGNVLTLDDDIDINFTDAEFRFGTVGSALVGDIEIDGKDNKAVPGYLTATWNCLGGLLSAGFTAKGDIRLKGGLTGGYMLMGARRANLEIESIDLCGHPADSLGASGWLFGSCTDTYVHVKRTSNGNISNAIDNKSSGLFSMGLWQPNYRFHVVHDVVMSHNIAHDVTASSDGYCGSSYADCSDALAGIFDSTPQSPAPIAATGVTIEIKGYKTFFAPTGNSLAGTGNSVRLGTYFSGATAILTADGAGADSRVEFRSAGVAKWRMISDLSSGSFTLYNGAFNAGVLLANQSATSWSAVSDRRVKEDIKTLSVLDRIAGFRAVSYTNKLTGAREIGVIAQDEVARAPEFVNRGSGSDDDEITSMGDNRVWSVSYDRYGVEALQGVKELLDIVRQQQVEIEGLKKR